MASTTPNRPSESASVGEVVDYVKRYAQQETVGPLKGAATWIVWGAMGAVAFGVGLALILLGILRLLQTEWSLSNSWNWLHYLIVLVATVVFLGVAFMQTKKTYLNKDNK